MKYSTLFSIVTALVVVPGDASAGHGPLGTDRWARTAGHGPRSSEVVDS